MNFFGGTEDEDALGDEESSHVRHSTLPASKRVQSVIYQRENARVQDLGSGDLMMETRDKQQTTHDPRETYLSSHALDTRKSVIHLTLAAQCKPRNPLPQLTRLFLPMPGRLIAIYSWR